MSLNLHALPKVKDSWTHLYIEHAKIDQDGQSIAITDMEGVTPVPCAALSLLLLGPGTSVSHAAIRTLAENGCLVGWAGEESVRFYALGMGETRSSRNLLHQARVWAHPTTRMAIVIRMYRSRFPNEVPETLSLRQLRGMEGARVRDAYARASRQTGVPWEGRSLGRGEWRNQSPINRALSSANSCLYGVCHAAIVAAGYSPGLGFIHTGKMLSFVYDIADLYKVELSIPTAFQVTAEGTQDLEGRVRRALRDAFRRGRLLPRIVSDIQTLLDIEPAPDLADFDEDAAAPGGLWDPVEGVVRGGVNWAEALEAAGEQPSSVGLPTSEGAFDDAVGTQLAPTKHATTQSTEPDEEEEWPW